jgi:hypothetical protein
MKHY